MTDLSQYRIVDSMPGEYGPDFESIAAAETSAGSATDVLDFPEAQEDLGESYKPSDDNATPKGGQLNNHGYTAFENPALGETDAGVTLVETGSEAGFTPVGLGSVEDNIGVTPAAGPKAQPERGLYQPPAEEIAAFDQLRHQGTTSSVRTGRFMNAEQAAQHVAAQQAETQAAAEMTPFGEVTPSTEAENTPVVDEPTVENSTVDEFTPAPEVTPMAETTPTAEANLEAEAQALKNIAEATLSKIDLNKLHESGKLTEEQYKFFLDLQDAIGDGRLNAIAEDWVESDRTNGDTHNVDQLNHWMPRLELAYAELITEASGTTPFGSVEAEAAAPESNSTDELGGYTPAPEFTPAEETSTSQAETTPAAEITPFDEVTPTEATSSTMPIAEADSGTTPVAEFTPFDDESIKPDPDFTPIAETTPFGEVTPEVTPVAEAALSAEAQAIKDKIETTLTGIDLKKLHRNKYLTDEQYDYYVELQLAIDDGRLDAFAKSWSEGDLATKSTLNASRVNQSMAEIGAIAAQALAEEGGFTPVEPAETPPATTTDGTTPIATSSPAVISEASTPSRARRVSETLLRGGKEAVLGEVRGVRRIAEYTAYAMRKPGEVRESRQADEIARERESLEQMHKIVDQLLGDKPTLPELPPIDESSIPELDKSKDAETEPLTVMTRGQFEMARNLAFSNGDDREVIRLIGEYLHQHDADPLPADEVNKLIADMAKSANEARKADRSAIVHAPSNAGTQAQPTTAESNSAALRSKEREVNAQYETVRDELKVLIYRLPKNSPILKTFQLDKGIDQFEQMMLDRIIEQMSPNPDPVEAQRQVGEAMATYLKHIKDHAFAPDDSRYSDEQLVLRSRENSDKILAKDRKKKRERSIGNALNIERSGRDQELLEDPEIAYKVEYLSRMYDAMPKGRLRNGSGRLSDLYAEINPKGMDIKVYMLYQARTELQTHGREPAKKILDKKLNNLISAGKEGVGSVIANQLDPRSQGEVGTPAPNQNKSRGSRPTPTAAPKPKANEAMRADKV